MAVNLPPDAESPIADRVGAGAAQYPTAPSLLPAERYRDPARYERELEGIFHHSWLAVAALDRLAAARDYVVWDGFGQSVVVVRLDSGELSAWHNVCQHRGARLVATSGTCPTGHFNCPWHGFSYGLDGVVGHVPLREAFDEAQLDGLRTPPVQVSESSGFAWINLDRDAAPLHEYLGELGGELAGYRLDSWDAPYYRTWEIGANWKTVIDAFNETWHVPFTHKTSVRGGLLWRDAAIRLFKPHSMMAIPVRKTYDPGLIAADDHRQTMLCHYLAFPNTVFNSFPDHVQVFTAWPSGPRTTRLDAWGLVAPCPEGMQPEAWRERADRDWTHFCGVVEEDREVLAAAGDIYDSLGFRRNMFNQAEGRLTAFHETVDERAGTEAADD